MTATRIGYGGRFHMGGFKRFETLAARQIDAASDLLIEAGKFLGNHKEAA